MNEDINDSDVKKFLFKKACGEILPNPMFLHYRLNIEYGSRTESYVCNFISGDIAYYIQIYASEITYELSDIKALVSKAMVGALNE